MESSLGLLRHLYETTVARGIQERLIADTAYGTAPMLSGLVDRKIAPHIPVFNKSGRNDGSWTRADFERDAENDQYIDPEGHTLQFRCNH